MGAWSTRLLLRVIQSLYNERENMESERCPVLWPQNCISAFADNVVLLASFGLWWIQRELILKVF